MQTYLKNVENTLPKDAQKRGLSRYAHTLADTELFTDDALALAIESHPAHLLDICVQGSFKTCNRNDFTGKQLIKAVREGAFWLNLRRIETIDSPIGNLIKELHSEAESVMDRKSSSRIGGLLISSPTAKVSYHFDLTDVTLWHIRGRKRIYIYPDEDPFLQTSDVENIAFERDVEKIPYSEDFDVHAIPLDLEPGQMIAWQHLAPHRIDNQSELNVSLSLESLSFPSRLTSGAHYFDGYLRQVWKKKILVGNKNALVKFVKTAISVIIKRVSRSRQSDPVTRHAFDLDLNSSGYYKPAEG